MFHGKAVAVITLLMVVSAARAQDAFSSVGDAGISMGESTISTMQTGLVFESIKRKAGGAKRGSSRGISRVAATTYRSDARVTARVESRYAQYAAGVSPNVGKIVAADMKNFDPAPAWSKVVLPYGLHSGDIADTLAGYYLLNYVIANKQTVNPTRVQVLAFRNRLKTGLARNQKFAAFTDAQKQELSEVLMLNYLYQQKAFSNAVAQNNPAALQKLADIAAKRFRKEMRLDPTKLVLTEKGFDPRS